MPTLDPFVHRKVVVVHENDPVRSAAQAMKRQQIGCVLVGDHEGHITGIATDRDLSSAVLAEGLSAEVPVSVAMTRDLVFVGPGADLKNVVQLMEQRGVRRIPVIERHHGGTQRVVGIVTLDDLIAARAVDFARVQRIVRSQVIRRAQLTPPPARAFTLKPASLGAGLEPGDMDAFRATLLTRISGKADLKEGEIEALARIVLHALARRVHHTAAVHLAMRLPQALREEILDLAPGPDRTVTSARILSEISRVFELDEAMSYAVLCRVCLAIEEWLSPGEAEHFKAQLPQDLKALFERPLAA